MRIIRSGSRGPDVHDVQQRLGGLGHPVDVAELDDAAFGPSTERAVRDFQQARSIKADGVVGVETWAHLVEAGYALGDRTLYLRYPYFRGDDVQTLQRKLNALGFDAWREDGIHGELVDRAVRDFQRNTGVEPDGIVGPDTLEALERLRPDLEAPSRALVRETESMRAGVDLNGAVVAIDAGHGGTDPGCVATDGLRESDAAYALALRVAEELAKRGACPELLRGRDEDSPAGDRAKRANALGAVACVSIHLNDGDPAASGSTCLYFGTGTTHSPAGRRLAETIQGELVARVGMEDHGAHPMALAILRETRMPAVQVEPCYITNAHEGDLLREPAFVADLALAIAIGVERFLAPVEP